MRKLDEFGQLAVERAIRNLFEERYFDICQVRTIADLLGVKPNPHIHDQLRQFHCVHYVDMDDRTKQLIQHKVVECLRGDVIFNPALVTSQLLTESGDYTFTEDRYIDGAPEKPKKSNGLLRLIGK